MARTVESYKFFGDGEAVSDGGGSKITTLPDLSDVSSAAQSDGNVLASGGSSYREEPISSMFSDHVSPISGSDISADSVGPTEIDSTTSTAYDIDISGDADTLDGVQGSNYARTDQDETFSGAVSSAGPVTHTGGSGRTRWASGATAGTYALELQTEDGNGNLATSLVIKGGSNSPDIQLLNGASGSEAAQVTFVNGGQQTGFSGVTAPSYAVEVSGDVRSTGEQEAFLGSDERLKTGTTPIGGALDKVCQIGGYGFQWHDEGAVQPHKRGKQDVGVIAQEVEQVLPEAVKTFEAGHSEGYKSVSYDKVVPLLIEAVKDLRSQVEALT